MMDVRRAAAALVLTVRLWLLSQLLVGKGIPEHIVSLPEEVRVQTSVAWRRQCGPELLPALTLVPSLGAGNAFWTDD